MEKCGIKKWKDKIPDMGFICGFKKNLQNEKSKDSSYFEKFLYEDIVASLLHIGTILLSPIFFVFLKPAFMSTIGTTTMLISTILNIMPVMVQRYNRPRLFKAYKHCENKEAREFSKLIIERMYGQGVEKKAA